MKNRIVLDLPEQQIAKIDSLKEQTGFSSRVSLIKYALGLLNLTDQKTKEGFRLQFVKGDTVIEAVLPL